MNNYDYALPYILELQDVKNQNEELRIVLLEIVCKISEQWGEEHPLIIKATAALDEVSK